MELKGFKLYRHDSNLQEKQLHDNFIEQFIDKKNDNYQLIDKIIFGTSNNAQTIPNDLLSDREKQICISLIQWLGSHVGQSFLIDNGFKITKNE